VTQAQPPDQYRQGDRLLDVVVVGGSQAGLAMAWHLARQGLRFVVLEAGPEVGHVWRNRWDSLKLFTPAQFDALPGLAFPAPADTYPTKDPVADYLQTYAKTFDLPVRPQALPDGPVLVVGGGNSGVQIAEELAATRTVELSIATTYPMLPQRFLGRDLFWWLTRLRLMRVTASSRLGRRVAGRGEFVIGTNRRRLEGKGVRFRPRLVDAEGRAVRFADHSLLEEVGVVVWATGYRSDYAWIHLPGVVREGQVVHRRGVAEVPGLYFLGLSWQHTRGSALLGAA
jgi:cation diffusion facilitator CzcD-associated flavoprotein CzcO